MLGYYTLSAAVLNADELPPDLAKKLPRYGQLPVTLLGRLAGDQRLRARGMGEFMLLDALHRSLEAAAGIAAMAVVVDAKDESAASFYRHFSFASLQKKAGQTLSADEECGLAVCVSCPNARGPARLSWADIAGRARGSSRCAVAGPIGNAERRLQGRQRANSLSL